MSRPENGWSPQRWFQSTLNRTCEVTFTRLEVFLWWKKIHLCLPGSWISESAAAVTQWERGELGLHLWPARCVSPGCKGETGRGTCFGGNTGVHAAGDPGPLRRVEIEKLSLPGTQCLGGGGGRPVPRSLRLFSVSSQIWGKTVLPRTLQQSYCRSWLLLQVHFNARHPNSWESTHGASSPPPVTSPNVLSVPAERPRAVVEEFFEEGFPPFYGCPWCSPIWSLSSIPVQF